VADLVLGAALGPRATEVEVRDVTSGTLVASGRAPHPGPDQHDPTSWWRSFTAAVAQTGQREIGALAVCGSHPGLVLLDGAGAVLPAPEPWSSADTTQDVARLERALGPERWARRAGALPGPTAAVSRLAWLRRAAPDRFAAIGAALLPHDWLTYRLAGRTVTDRGSASLTGAWSPAAEGWLAEVLDLLAPGESTDWWRERLPTVLGPSEQADWLDAPVFELLGLRGRPIVGPGTGEAMAVALALEVTPGRAAVSVGARTTVLVGIDEPVVDPTGTVRSRADATGRHLAVSTAPGGAGLVEVVREVLGMARGEMGPLAERAPGRTDISIVPGARDAGATLSGLVPGVTRPDVARAAFEGVAGAALDALELILAAGATWSDDEPLRLAAPSADVGTHAWVLAQRSGRPVQPAPDISLAAAGACVQAAAVWQGAPPEDVAARWQLGRGPRVEPEPTG
jgi:xylulokinase